MSLTSKTKEELADIIEGQLGDIKMLEAEVEGMWDLLEDIKDSESMTYAMLGERKPVTIKDMTAEEIASFFTPIDE